MNILSPEIEEILDSLLLHNLEFIIDGKCIKRGILHQYSLNNSFIRLSIDRGKKIENFDIPIWFGIDQTENGYIIDYTLQTLSQNDIDLFVKLVNIQPKKQSRFFNVKMNIVTIINEE